MHIQKQITCGEQFGGLTVDAEGLVTIGVTNLKGSLQLGELEAVLKEARNLYKRLNPPTVTTRRRKRK